MMLANRLLALRIFIHSLRLYWQFTTRSLRANLLDRRRCRLQNRKPTSSSDKTADAKDDSDASTNIVIIGASFAGYYAARTLAESLPLSTPYTITVIEPNSHFQFTWLLPRFSVVPGHESKLFIPYGPYIRHNRASVRWIQDRAVSITREAVKLEKSGEEVRYGYLVLATGSTSTRQENVLPSRVGVPGREEGMEVLRGLQERVRQAEKVVVVGGGAAGVEIAADAREMYPEKKVVLVHSRMGLMHRFEEGLQVAAKEALERLGVEVVLGERVVRAEGSGSEGSEEVVLSSGRRIECDLLIDCTGQRPASTILEELAPGAIAPSGHVRIKSTLQIDDDSLPNVYICGDLADAGCVKPNARAAMAQALVAADNIIQAIQGKTPSYTYTPHWIEGVIKLTLGLYDSVVYFGHGKAEFLQRHKETKITLMADDTWAIMGVSPEQDSETAAGESMA